MLVRSEDFGKSKSFIISSKADNKEELKSSNVDSICTQEPNIPCLINKSIEAAKENKEAGLILAASLGAAIIIYSISKSVSEVVKAWRSND
jgi:hypothetical protein